MSKDSKVLEENIGRFAQSIESGWTGLIVDVERHSDDPLDTFYKMQGLDRIAWIVGGGEPRDYVDSEDIQWFSPFDVKLYKKVEATPTRKEIKANGSATHR